MPPSAWNVSKASGGSAGVTGGVPITAVIRKNRGMAARAKNRLSTLEGLVSCAKLTARISEVAASLPLPKTMLRSGRDAT